MISDTARVFCLLLLNYSLALQRRTGQTVPLQAISLMRSNNYLMFLCVCYRFGKKSRPAMYDATPISYEDYSPDDKPLVALIKTKDL